MPAPFSLPDRLVKRGRIATAAIALLTVALTLTPGDEQIHAPGGMDKLFHFLAFFALVLPVALTEPRRWVLLVCLAAGLGGAIELIQPHVGRQAEWGDALANAAGALAGALLGRWLHPRLFRPPQG
jgi:VanZ family protein